MDLASSFVIIVGLVVFEIISSIDNAVVNADVLSTMSPRARKWFLTYGILFAVFIIRGLMPLLIVYVSNPELGIVGAFTATFSSDPHVHEIIEAQKPILLAGGGVYLIYLFFHWLFIEKKEYAFFVESFIHRKLSFWFYATVAVLLTTIVWVTVGDRPMVALGAVIGSTAFFITNGFKQNAEEKEKELVAGSGLSDLSKIIYLEVIDTTFSIDGVLGAFAFTLSVPLILFGNGIGAFIVRGFTIKGIETVKKYRYLKNGAMYSICLLGTIMTSEALGIEIVSWVPPVTTIVLIVFFFWLSTRALAVESHPHRNHQHHV
jgi:hypothetical protein